MEIIKKGIGGFVSLWKTKSFFAACFVFLIVFSFYAAIYIPSPGVVSTDDHFFHFRYAGLIRENGWSVIENFPWIYLSKAVTENTHYSFSLSNLILIPYNVRYPVSLYNLSLIPFTYIDRDVLGLKVSDIFWLSLALSLLYYLLRTIKIKYAFFYILILLTIIFISSRFLLGRALVLVPIIILWEIYFSANKKYKEFFILSLFHILWHQSTFFMPLMIVCLVELSRYIVDQKIYFKNIYSSITALIIGMAFYPDFPKNILGFIHGILTTLKDISVNPNLELIEGNELVPITLLSFWNRSDIAILFFILCFLIFIYFYGKDKKENINEKNINLEKWKIITYPTFLFTFLSFSFSIIFSGRFLDFYFISTIFLFALIIKRIFDEKLIFSNNLNKFIFSGFLVFFLLSFLNTLTMQKAAFDRVDYNGIKNASEWIKDKSSEKENVFLFDWDNFPVSFFYNQKNYYSMGIEPRIILDYNPKLYWKWYNIFLYNYYCDKPEDCAEEKSEIIKSLRNDDQKIKDFNQENSKKIIYSIKNDFKSHFIISNSATFSSIIQLNPDLIEDSYTYTSKVSGEMDAAFELK